MKLLFAGLLIGLTSIGPAWADCAVAGLTLEGTLVPKVGVFDTTGKFLEEISLDHSRS